MRSYFAFLWIHHRWRLLVSVVGIAVLIVGGSTHGGALPLAGIGLIAASVAPLPWGTDAYRRRLSRALRTAAHSTEATRRWSRARQLEREQLLRRNDVPTRFAAEVEELRALQAEAAKLRDDRHFDFAERAVRVFELRSRRRGAVQRLAAEADASAELVFSKSLISANDEADRDAERQEAENRDALSGLLRAVEQSRPPERFRARHDALIRVAREQVSALVAYGSAAHGSDVEALRSAAERYARAAEVAGMCLRELGLNVFTQPSRRSSERRRSKKHGNLERATLD